MLRSPLQPVLRSPLSSPLERRRGGGAAFDIASFFAGGEQGAVFDISDLSTLFQDTAGTVPVTAAGQTVARINDKSGRGNHATQATAGNRAVLQQDAKGAYYLDCVGGARFYNIPSISASSVDKALVAFAARKNSSAARAVLFETAPDYGRAGAIGIALPYLNGSATSAAYLRGTTEATYYHVFPDNVTSVISYSLDIAGAGRLDEIKPLVDGFVPPDGNPGLTGNAGTGNFTNNPYSLGARSNGTLPFNGRIYGFFLCFRQIGAQDVSKINAWLAERAGIDYTPSSGYLGFEFLPGQLTNPTLSLTANYLQNSTITFTTTAVGAVPAGGGARPTLSLVNNSITHPKVLHIPQGFAGYKYWMAATPFFGVVGSESQYENPHIFCSNDGINFIEPPGITNPLDLAENEYPNHSYWSDTHLMMGDDGYLYCYYRGVGIAFGATQTNYYRRSLDGVNWSARTLLCSSSLTVSPVVMKTGAATQDYYEVRLVSGRPIARVPMTGPGSVSDKSLGSDITLDSAPWAADQGPWHLDVERFGGLTIALINTGPSATSGGNELWIAYSVDGQNFKVMPTKVGPASGMYRSTIVPLKITAETIELLLYAAQTNGVTQVWRVAMAIS